MLTTRIGDIQVLIGLCCRFAVIRVPSTHLTPINFGQGFTVRSFAALASLITFARDSLAFNVVFNELQNAELSYSTSRRKGSEKCKRSLACVIGSFAVFSLHRCVAWETWCQECVRDGKASSHLTFVDIARAGCAASWTVTLP